jgi:flagellar basal-body rod protein FlgB
MDKIGAGLFNKTIDLMGKSLGLRLERHNLTAGNLANMDTPGYRVRDLKFEKSLQRAVASANDGKLQLMQTKAEHMPQNDLAGAYQAARQDVKYSVYGRDENGQDVMDIDREMTKLAKNHLVYNTTVQMLAKEFENLKYAISEGGR